MQQKQRQTSEAWVLYFYSLLSPRKDARPLISFLPLPPRATKAKADERSLLGAVLSLYPLPPQGCKAPHLFFTPSPSGNKSKGRRAKPGVLKFFSLLSPAGMQGPSSHFFFSCTGNKSSGRAKPGCCSFSSSSLLLPPQGCKAPHLFFTLRPSGNKSKGRRAKPGVLKFFSLLSPRKDSGPLISFIFSCTGNKSSGRAMPGCCSFSSSSSSSSSPPARMQGPSSLFRPFPFGQQKQRQTSEALML